MVIQTVCLFQLEGVDVKAVAEGSEHVKESTAPGAPLVMFRVEVSFPTCDSITA